MIADLDLPFHFLQQRGGHFERGMLFFRSDIGICHYWSIPGPLPSAARLHGQLVRKSHPPIDTVACADEPPSTLLVTLVSAGLALRLLRRFTTD